MTRKWLVAATVVAATAGVGSGMAVASRSAAPSAVRQAFAGRRFVSGQPREVNRARSPHGSLVLWAAPASGGGWCEGLQRPHARFNRMSVSCTWPRSSLRHQIDLNTIWPKLYYGRVPQQSARSLRLRLSDGHSLSVPMTNRYFLFLIPDSVLAHAVPRALVAYDAGGGPVARAAFPAGLAALNGFGFGGIRKPPGGAALGRKREAVMRPTAVGRASIWVAPDRVSAAHCSWLQISRAVYGGSCLRDQSSSHGLPETVPLVLTIKAQTLPLLWGQVGTNVARLGIVFQDGSHTNLSYRDGVFLYPVPQSRWNKGHRPAFLVARDAHGRVVGKRLLYEYTLAP